MRIGISCYPTHGGSGVIATELGKHLAERGHEVAFISYASPIRLTDLPERVSFYEVEGEDYPLLKQFPYTLALASKMAEVATMKGLQIIHVHYAIPFAVAAIIAKQIVAERDIKVVTTLHGTDITIVGSNASLKPITTFAIEHSDAVTAVSKFLMQETYRQFEVTKKIHVIYNFINPNRHICISSSSVQKAKHNRQFTLIHISNFRPVKRIGDVIKIFQKVSQTLPARLVMVGDGPECSMAEKMVRDLGLSEIVDFLGVVDDVAPLLMKADLLLLPSENESFGLVALEAMTSCVPVVATNAGGLPEVVEHGVSGYLAPVGDIDKMAEYAVKILSEHSRKDRFAEMARKRAIELFDYHNIVPQYEALYNKILRS